MEDTTVAQEFTSNEEKSKTINHKDSALKRLDISFNKHIEAAEYKQSNLLAYWIKDFANYHDDEKTFSPNSLKIFKRGDIVKVNLGFNIGQPFFICNHFLSNRLIIELYIPQDKHLGIFFQRLPDYAVQIILSKHKV